MKGTLKTLTDEKVIKKKQNNAEILRNVQSCRKCVINRINDVNKRTGQI